MKNGNLCILVNQLELLKPSPQTDNISRKFTKSNRKQYLCHFFYYLVTAFWDMTASSNNCSQTTTTKIARYDYTKDRTKRKIWTYLRHSLTWTNYVHHYFSFNLNPSALYCNWFNIMNAFSYKLNVMCAQHDETLFRHCLLLKVGNSISVGKLVCVLDCRTLIALGLS